MEKGRLIIDGPNSAPFNMAADAYLLEQAESSASVPTLRLYGWLEPSISIGFHQKPERAIDLDRVGSTPIVRRPTGGRALFHDGFEMTYALAGNHRLCPALGQTLHQTYLLMAQAIVAFYSHLGWDAVIYHRSDPAGPRKSGPIQKGCFASVSRYEILIGGQKMAASSQRRSRTAFLQHGAIKLGSVGSHPAILDGFSQESAPLRPDMVDRSTLEECLAGAVSEALGIRFEAIPFTALEKAVISERMAYFAISPV